LHLPFEVEIIRNLAMERGRDVHQSRTIALERRDKTRDGKSQNGYKGKNKV
jgi:hypothetical protein